MVEEGMWDQEADHRLRVQRGTGDHVESNRRIARSARERLSRRPPEEQLPVQHGMIEDELFPPEVMQWGFAEPKSNIQAELPQLKIHEELATLDATRASLLKFMYPDVVMPQKSVAHVSRPQHNLGQCPGKWWEEATKAQKIALRAWSTAAQSAAYECYAPPALAAAYMVPAVRALVSHKHRFIFWGGKMETSPALEKWLRCRFGAEWVEHQHSWDRYENYTRVTAQVSVEPVHRALAGYLEAVQQVFDTLEASEAGALGTWKPAGEYPRLRKEVEDSKHRIWNGSHMPPYSLDGFRQYLLDAAHSKSIVSTGGGGGWGGASAYIRPAA